MTVLSKMIWVLIKELCLITLIGNLHSAAEDNNHCRDRDRLIESDEDDLYELVDAILGQKCTLQCHYCHEKDDERPKDWYRVIQFGSAPHEILPDMKNNATNNRLVVNSDHSLTINTFGINDTGLYYCKRFEEDLPNEKFNYLVDSVLDENITSVETGNFTEWRKYYEEYFNPVNILFTESQGVEFKKVRDDLQIDMKMVSRWDSWSACDVCGRPQNEGIRKKNGLCRIKLFHKNTNDTISRTNPDEMFLKNATAVSCRSQAIERIVPGISNLTRIIPNFVQTEPCQGTCNPVFPGLKRRTTLETVVVWKKNGKLLKPGESVQPSDPEDEPRIIVDTFNTLYLVNVKESEEGNYTCYVDVIRMEQITIYVISKARVLTQAFVRHMVYLGFILSLSLPCYCAGLVIACSKRHVFKGYEELKEIDEEKRKNPYFNNV